MLCQKRINQTINIKQNDMTHTFTINNQEYLGVLVPTTAHSFRMSVKKSSHFIYMTGNGNEAEGIDLQTGKYELICATMDVTEEQAKAMGLSLVEFHSLMQKEGMYSVNPFGDKEPEPIKCECPCHKDDSIMHVTECCDNGLVKGSNYFKWQTAQARVGNWVILAIIKK